MYSVSVQIAKVLQVQLVVAMLEDFQKVIDHQRLAIHLDSLLVVVG